MWHTVNYLDIHFDECNLVAVFCCHFHCVDEDHLLIKTLVKICITLSGFFLIKFI